MSSKSIKVTLNVIDIDRSNNNLITVPKNVYNEIKARSIKTLKVGLLEERVDFNLNNSENIVEIHCKLAENLGLSDDSTINFLIKDNKVSLGPVIGVFAANGSVRKANIQIPSFRMVELMNANKDANTIVYYFSIKDVDFLNKKINGTYFDEKESKWAQRWFPLPEVLYDRGGGTLKRQKTISKYIRKQLAYNKDLKKFNERYYFDKWDTYEKLVKYEEMKPYLPLTKLYKEPEDLLEMFEESSTLYIKTCFGSNGRGVARAIKQEDGSFKFSYFHEEVLEYNLKYFNELVDKINDIFGKKKTIIQSAIDVININGGNVDMRATVQRNGNNEIGATAYPVRVGKEKCPITSTKSGSTVYTLDNFFTKYYDYTPEQIEALKQEINKLLFASFNCVSEVYGRFGELGIDFAIDKKGKIWFIECNAKPGKDTLYLSYDKATIKKAFLKPLEYCKYICEF